MIKYNILSIDILSLFFLQLSYEANRRRTHRRVLRLKSHEYLLVETQIR